VLQPPKQDPASSVTLKAAFIDFEDTRNGSENNVHREVVWQKSEVLSGKI
jgi:hypothetical protein